MGGGLQGVIGKTTSLSHRARCLENTTQCFVDRFFAGKRFSYVRLEQDNVRALSIFLVMLSAYSAAQGCEIILRSHIVATSALIRLLHRIFFPFA
jgi:hypothetical protein